MIDKQHVVELQAQAGQGRGFWLGLKIPTGEPHPLREHLKDDAHVTVLHLGKKVKPEEVETICHCLGKLESFSFDFNIGPLRAEVTGCGFFWRYRTKNTVIGLINSARLFSMRADIMHFLSAAGVKCDDKYGFVPHVTLPDAELADLNQLFAAGPMVVHFPTLHIICGDVSVAIT